MKVDSNILRHNVWEKKLHLEILNVKLKTIEPTHTPLVYSYIYIDIV